MPTAELDLSPSSPAPETVPSTMRLNCFSRSGAKTDGFRNVTPGQEHLSWYQGFTKLVSHVQGRLRGSPMAFPWPALGSKTGSWTPSVPAGCFQSTGYLPSIVGVSILHFTSWPALLKTPSRAESSEWPRPNWKRQDSVGQAVTLALSRNCYLP